MKTYKISQIPNKRILGRNVADAGNNDKPLALFWAASALEINVKSKEVWVKISSNYDSAEPWCTVFVNGAPTNRFLVHSGEPQWICISINANSEKENLISIIKDTQPMTAEQHHSLFIHEIGLSDDGEFCEVKPRKMNIEFIGDSITSGEGLTGNPDENDWIPQWFSSSKTYAVKTAKNLDANWSCVSQSGWGLCWAWDGNTNNIIPPHYEEVCSVMWGSYQDELGVNQKYDFGPGSDVVVINLGTNDNGAFFQPPWKDENGVEHVLHRGENDIAVKEDGDIISKGVEDFLTKVRRCNPNAKIIWCWGMIKLVAIPGYIKAGVESYKNHANDKNVYTLELDSMEDVEKTPEDKGSRGHPGPLTHSLAAKKLSDFINSIR